MHKSMEKSPLFESGVEPVFNTKLFNDGNGTSCVVSSRLNRRGAIAKANFRLQTSKFWSPEEVILTDDAKQWSVMEEDYKYAVKVILSYINFLDSKMSLMPSEISAYLSNTEFTLPLAFQQGMEAVHTHTYSYIYECVMGVTEEIETTLLFVQDPILVPRIQSITESNTALRDNPTLENLNKAMLSIYLLEGIYFFNGFNFFYYLGASGYLKGVEKLISSINRDEVTHLILFKELINIAKEDGQWVLTDEEVFQQFEDAIKVEEAFAHNLLSSRFLPFSKENVSMFVRYLANKRLKFLGYKTNPYNEYKTNPYKVFSRFEPDGEVQGKEVNILTGMNMDYEKVDKSQFDW